MHVFKFTEDFRDSLQVLAPETQEQIKNKLGWYAHCQNPLLLAKKLRGCSGIYRLRAGDYQAIFRLEGHTYVFLLVKYRKDIYKGLQ